MVNMYEFKIWDSTHKKWWSIDNRITLGDEEMSVHNCLVGLSPKGEYILINQFGFIWVPYTNVQDKNRKKVYAGDLVIASSEYTDKWPQPVFYIAKNTGWYIGFDEDNVTSLSALQDIEVVGNIYENTKLYKEALKKYKAAVKFN